MLRLARDRGHLHLDPNTFATWTRLNDVALHDVRPSTMQSKGTGLVAVRRVQNSESGAECLLTVPRDLILSEERVKEQAKADRDLRDVLEACNELCQTARGVILIFLLLQCTTACGADFQNIGVHSPFIEYVKSLPIEPLPTMWTADELDLLVGTTLAPATAHKLRSLRREYDLLCSAVTNTKWYQHVKAILNFEDWIEVDAMYRSRALDYPGIGHCMVPCLDLANHQSGDGTVAVYDLDTDGNAILLLRSGKVLEPGAEITISYGDEKGACEMLFSYGFLEDNMTSGECLFLDLGAQSDDPLALYKRRIADCAPGVRLIDAADGQIDWQGDFIWLLCVSEEDGLHFDVARLLDGSEEVQAFLGDDELKGGAAGLHRLLAVSELWDVYRLRAVAMLQDRVFSQLQILDDSQEIVQATQHGTSASILTHRYQQALALRKLEFELLNQAYEDFERQKMELAESKVVKSYLNAVNGPNEPEDFS